MLFSEAKMDDTEITKLGFQELGEYVRLGVEFATRIPGKENIDFSKRSTKNQ